MKHSVLLAAEDHSPAETPRPGNARRHSLLMLAYYFPPENTSGADRPFRFAKYLPQFGYSTRVIANTGPEEGGKWDYVSRVPRPDCGRGATFTSFASRGAEIVQRFILPYNEQLPWVPHAVEEASRWISQTPVDVLLSTSPPVATHLAAMQLKQRFGVRWVADFRDPLVGNSHRNRRLWGPYDAMLERWIFRRADALIANTASAADAWRERYPQFAYKIQTIWNGFDPEDPFGPAPIPARGYKVLVHVGNLYGGRDPGMLFRSLERLIARGQADPAKIRVLLAGALENPRPSLDSPRSSVLHASGCVQCTNRLLPRDQARRIVAEADYLLLIEHRCEKGVQVPAKLFDYIRTGRPILALTAQKSPAEQILAKSGVPYRCLYHDSPEEETDARLREFLALPNHAVIASPWFWEQFDGKAQAAMLSSLLAALRD